MAHLTRQPRQHITSTFALLPLHHTPRDSPIVPDRLPSPAHAQQFVGMSMFVLIMSEFADPCCRIRPVTHGDSLHAAYVRDPGCAREHARGVPQTRLRGSVLSVRLGSPSQCVRGASVRKPISRRLGRRSRMFPRIFWPSHGAFSGTCLCSSFCGSCSSCLRKGGQDYYPSVPQ